MTSLEWHIPHPPLRASILRASVLGLLVVVGVAEFARAWLQLGALYPVKAAAAFAAAMVISFGLIGRYHPYARFGPANYATMIRAAVAALVASLIEEAQTPRLAMAASGAGAMTILLDGVDGWLARRGRMISAFGARFDIEIDSVLVMAMSLLVWQHRKAGPWALFGGAMRYLFVMAGWWLPWMSRPLSPTRRARIMAVCHLAGLSAALAPFVSTRVSAMTVASTLAALSWSFAVDVRRLWRMR